MSRRALWIGCLIATFCAGSWLLADPTHAQGTQQDQPESPDAALKLAQQLAQHGRFVKAAMLLEGVLHRSGDSLKPNVREQLNQQLRDLSARMGTFAVTLAPAGATVQVGGTPAVFSNGNVLRLDPGEHEIVATADGYRELRRTLNVNGGERQELRLLLAPVQGDPETARRHFQRGEVAYAQGDYELATREWHTAYAIDPRPLIQFALAQAYERMGRLTDAVEALKLYLQSADPKDVNQADARARLAALESRLQRTGVTISGGIEGAMILVDGQEWGRLPRPDRIALAPGHHRIVIRMDGYQDYVSNIVVPPGQVVEISVDMEKDGAVATMSPTSSASGGTSQGMQMSTDGGGSSGLPWFIASGVLAAGTVGALIYGLERNSTVSDCNQANVFCSRQGAVESERTLGLIGAGVLGVGAIGTLIVGVIVQGNANSERASITPCLPSLGSIHCSLQF